MDKLHEFRGTQIRVTWSKSRCIHFAACVRGLPAVFQPGERPWIQLEGAAAREVAEVVMRCPTGALHFEPLDGGAAEAPETSNTIRKDNGSKPALSPNPRGRRARWCSGPNRDACGTGPSPAIPPAPGIPTVSLPAATALPAWPRAE